VGDLRVDMRPKSHPRPKDVADRASQQHGVVTYRQLRRMGFSHEAIKRRIRVGEFHPLYRGVYAVGHTAMTRRGLLMAAVYACGEGAVASHWDAAELWGLSRNGGKTFHVTVVAKGRKSRKGITLHQVRRLDRADWTEVDNVRVTSLARTFLDQAEVVNRRQLERQLETAERQQIFDLRAIKDTCRRNPGRHGIPILIAAVNELMPEALHSREELERLFLDFCREHNIPMPAVNVVVEGYSVDALWRAQRVVVELDSREFHLNRKAFEEDRRRDGALQIAGYRVLRITWRRLTQEPAGVASDILTLLAHAPAASSVSSQLP